MKDPCAIFNTHISSVDGIVTVDDPSNMRKMKVDVRFTSDNGETLSFSVANLQIAVPFEEVEQLIEETRKDRIKA